MGYASYLEDIDRTLTANFFGQRRASTIQPVAVQTPQIDKYVAGQFLTSLYRADRSLTSCAATASRAIADLGVLCIRVNAALDEANRADKEIEETARVGRQAQTFMSLTRAERRAHEKPSLPTWMRHRTPGSLV